jgi:hypothetical protein
MTPTDSLKDQKLECSDKDNTVKYPGDSIDFLDQLLHKCVVSNYADMYQKLLLKCGGLIRCEELFTQDAKKSLERILETTVNIKNILVIFLFPPKKTQVDSKDPNAQFQKIPYLTNLEGLQRVIINYRREKYLRQAINFEDLCTLWNISKDNQSKLIEMLNSLMESNKIYAYWQEGQESEKGLTTKKMFVFKKILEVPLKRTQLLQLVIAIALFVTAITVFWIFIFSKQ